MSELPENLEDWPESPYEILGVSHENSEREVRSAYVKLIKIFKPEKFPEHFRRIRDAYDRISQYLKLNSRADDGQREILNLGNGLQVSINFDDEKPETRPITSHAEVEEFEIASARPEQIRTIYEELKHRSEIDQADHSDYLQMHWMTYCFPEFDDHRTAFQWLMTGLKKLGLDTRLVQVLKSRIELEPTLILDQAVTDLLMSQPNSFLLTTLADLRWSIAVKSNHLDLIKSDLKSLRPVVLEGQHDPHGWIRLTAKAIECLGWSQEKTETLCKRLHDEIDQLQEFQFEVDSELDRLEFVTHLQKMWAHMRNSRVRLIQETGSLIPATWSHRFGEIPAAELDNVIIDWSEKVLERATYPIRQFDDLANMSLGNFDGSAVLRYLLNFFENRFSLRMQRRQPDKNMKYRIQSFLGRCESITYSELRMRILEFCCDEWVEPYELMAFIAQEPQFEAVCNEYGLLQSLADDLSLQLVFRAHQTFWS